MISYVSSLWASFIAWTERGLDDAAEELKLHGEESRLLTSFKADPQETYKPLLDFLLRTRPFSTHGRYSWSLTKRIVVCNDIYGYEVKIDDGQLIDCSPSSYGLTKAQGDALFEAILTNVPGSTPFRDRRMPRHQYEEDHAH